MMPNYIKTHKIQDKKERRKKFGHTKRKLRPIPPLFSSFRQCLCVCMSDCEFVSFFPFACSFARTAYCIWCSNIRLYGKFLFFELFIFLRLLQSRWCARDCSGLQTNNFITYWYQCLKRRESGASKTVQQNVCGKETSQARGHRRRWNCDLSLKMFFVGS